MIDEVLSGIVEQLNTFVGTTEPEVVLGNISMMDSQDTSSQVITDKVIVSVINIVQENSLRNLPFRRSVKISETEYEGVERQPEIYLNIYLLFGANKNEYRIALQRISQVISFFQRQFVFTASDLPVLDTVALNKIVFDMYSTGFEELNQLWSIMGGRYIPSVIYKMRLAVIQESEEQDASIITEIERDLDVWDSAPEIENTE